MQIDKVLRFNGYSKYVLYDTCKFMIAKFYTSSCLHFLIAYIHYDRQNITLIQIIPQGTVDNNQGPDRFAGQKALDPSY